MEPQHRQPSDAERALLRALAAEVRAVDPVPEEVVVGARDVFTWHEITTRLAVEGAPLTATARPPRLDGLVRRLRRLRGPTGRSRRA